MLESLFQLLYAGRGTIFFFIILFLAYLFKSRFVIISHWHHTYDKAQFSTMDFYSACEQAIKERNLPGATLKRVIHNNRIFFSGSREYLRVYRMGIAYDICAAPNGSGCYVSWWHHEHYSNFERLVMMKIPVLNWVYREQTLHQYDLELMFQDVIHACVMEAADAMTGVKGSTLSESERSIIHNWTALK